MRANWGPGYPKKVMKRFWGCAFYGGGVSAPPGESADVKQIAERVRRSSRGPGCCSSALVFPELPSMDETPGMARYAALVTLWMQAREKAGGKLTQAEEARWMSYCDRVWTTLSEDEQDALEAARQPPPSTP